LPCIREVSQILVQAVGGEDQPVFICGACGDLTDIIHFGLLRFLVFDRNKYTEEDLFVSILR
jgi:hypothetical protein